MKDIDIIKAAQHVSDKYVNEAIDFAPVPKHSFKWVYAAAACAAAVVIAVPIAVNAHSSYTPVNSQTGSASGSMNASSSSGAVPVIPDAERSEDTPRTFYNVVSGEQEKTPGAAHYGKVNITDELAKCLAKPHDPQDLFAVSVSEHSHGDIQKIYDEFAEPYDLNRWFTDTDGEGALFMTEEEIKAVNNSKLSSDLTIVLDLADTDYYAEEIDAESLKNERFSKMYAEITLDFSNEETDDEQMGGKAIIQKRQELTDEFTSDYGIDTRLLFAGQVTLYDARDVEGDHTGKICGEFDAETIEKILGDKRVKSIRKSNGGGYVYEEYGMFLSAVKVTEKQAEKLPAGLTYREIFERLGNTAAFGQLNSRYYVTEDAKLIILKYDNVNDACALSGNELYDSAIPLYYDGERPGSADDNMTYSVTGNGGLFIKLNSSGYLTAGYGSQAHEGCEIIHEDGTPASKEELDPIGKRLFFTYDIEFMTYPGQYHCTKIVILDD